MSKSHAPVLVEILEPTESLPFPLYLMLGESLILFRTKKDSLGESDIAELRENHKEALFTPTDEGVGYLPLLRRSFATILKTDEAPKQALRRCYERGAVATELVLRYPEEAESADCAEAFVGALVHILEKCAFSYTDVHDVLKSDPSFAEHAINVSVQGVLLGGAVGTPDLPHLGLALLLHDIGVLELDPADRIPDPDDAEQVARYRRHPDLGAELLADVYWCDDRIVDVVRNHHECIDGSGYGRGLSGDDISPWARIAGIVNTFDRRTARGVRDGDGGSFPVLQQMLAQDSRRFDGDFLRAFVSLLAS